MRRIWGILTNFIIGILIICVIILMYCVFQTNILKKDYPNLFGYTIFQVETGSMENTIQIEDFVIIKIGDKNISENDIITYKEGDYYITHRVILIDGEYITTKGDNNNIEDTPITQDKVLGKVVYIIKNVSIWKKVFSNIKVIISCSITMILFIILVAYKEKVNKDRS